MGGINTPMFHESGSSDLATSRATHAQLLGRERQDAALVAELRNSNSPLQVDLADRMERCSADRARLRGRRRQPDLTDVVSHGPPWTCKTTACTACRKRHHVRPNQKKVFRRWDKINPDNAWCSLATIHLGRLEEIHDIRPLVLTFRRALRDLRRGRPAWNDFEVSGVVEVDLLHEYEIPFLLSDRAELLPTLPKIGSNGSGMMWLPHAHLAIHHPGVDRAQVRKVLKAEWTGLHRVHVMEFDQAQTAAQNAANVVGYGAKNHCETRIGNEIETWSPSALATWWTVFRAWSRGLEPVRVIMRPVGARGGRSS